MLLDGKRVLVLGLMDTRCFGWKIGQAIAAQGAEVLYTCQRERIVRGFFRREGVALPETPLYEMDVTDEVTIESVLRQVGAPLHGLVFSIAFASPESCLGGRMDRAPVADVLRALHVLSFDSQHSWPAYNWMGVAKAALEALVRGLQRDYGPMGIRVNTLSPGPQETLASTHIPGFQEIADVFPPRAPLGWDLKESGRDAAGAAAFLLSDLAAGIGGTVLTVDGGAHAMGAPLLE